MDPKVLNASGNNIWHRIQIEFHVRRVKKKVVEENKTIDKITSMAMATTPPLPQRTIDKRMKRENAEKRCLPFRVSVRVNTYKAQDKSIELLLIVIRRHNRMSFFRLLDVDFHMNNSSATGVKGPIINSGRGKSIKLTNLGLKKR